MKLTVKMHRCTRMPCAWLLRALGLSADVHVDEDMVLESLRQRFGILAPTVKLWWPSKEQWDAPNNVGQYPDNEWEVNRQSCVVSIEAAGFDIRKPESLFSGRISADPSRPEDMHRLDGALVGELRRWGITADADCFDWGMEYEGREDESEAANRARNKVGGLG